MRGAREPLRPEESKDGEKSFDSELSAGADVLCRRVDVGSVDATDDEDIQAEQEYDTQGGRIPNFLTGIDTSDGCILTLNGFETEHKERYQHSPGRENECSRYLPCAVSNSPEPSIEMHMSAVLRRGVAILFSNRPIDCLQDVQWK
jgi:hypothetical protein